MVPEVKICRACGRRITWRKKWARDWDQVVFCSAACRGRGLTDQDRQLEAAIRDLLARRPRSGSISDVDAARAVSAQHGSDLVEPARRAARRLSAAGVVEILQHGRVVDVDGQGDLLDPAPQERLAHLVDQCGRPVRPG